MIELLIDSSQKNRVDLFTNLSQNLGSVKLGNKSEHA